jgi:hypothetical protein
MNITFYKLTIDFDDLHAKSNNLLVELYLDILEKGGLFGHEEF